MALFLSTFHKKIDKKGRVSVPSEFRTVLAGEPFNGIVAYQSFVNACIEGCGISRVEALNEKIEALDPFSEERKAFETAIFGGSKQLPFDGEGRVMLPESLLAAASISQELVFVGQGQTFEIWNPGAYEEYEQQARKLALEKRQHLRANAGGGGA